MCFCVYVLCVSKTHPRVLFNEGSPDWSQVWTCRLPIIPPTPAQGAKVSKKVRSFVSENQMFQILAGIPSGRGERLLDGGKISQ